jgi:type 1 glutamine amidotransferase
MPVIDYNAALNVLVAVRGHPFDRNAFEATFQAMPGVTATMVDQPAAAQLMNPQGMQPYHALVLYDMPGMDFDAVHDKPAFIDPGPAFKDGFVALLAQGKGIVALHHALAGWPAWPFFGEQLGGTFLYRPGELRGAARADSGYRHDVDYQAVCLAPEHPVMQGVPAQFSMHDELYMAEIYPEGITPLLRARHEFTAANFHSAQAAMQGRLYDNAGWHHADGSDLIGWAKMAGNSRLVYLQPGHDHHTYNNPAYRRMLENAIRYVAERKAAVLF